MNDRTRNAHPDPLLFTAPGTCAQAVHILLEQSGAAYGVERLDFGSQAQQSPEFLRINPKGRVPALVTARGVLTETPAILLYICQRWPEAGLAPLDDPFALAQAQAFNSYLCATVHVAHAHGRRAARWADTPEAVAAMKQKMPANMAACFELIEHQLFAGPWVMGDRYSLCDPYLFTIAGWLEGDGVDIERFPQVADHRRRMLDLPAVQAVLAAHRGG